MSQHYDFIILGQGIAGTTVAWELMARGARFLIIDRDDEVTSSKIAAGLMTPITGKRLVMSPDWETNWNEAKKFYQDVENRTTSSCYLSQPMLRIFQTETERERFEQREREGQYDGGAVRQLRTLSSDLIDPGWGGIEMEGGRLLTRNYLLASREYFSEAGQFLKCDLDLLQEISIDQQQVTIPCLNISAERLILCQGFQHLVPEWMQPIRFNACKGEILSVEINELSPERVIHKKIWIAPEQQGLFRVGATYDWDDLTEAPTANAKQELLDDLGKLVAGRFRVCAHQAAIRPTMKDFLPIVGTIPTRPRVSILNGLGSKGSLWAPVMAKRLVRHLLDGEPIPEQFEVSRWYD